MPSDLGFCCFVLLCSVTRSLGWGLRHEGNGLVVLLAGVSSKTAAKQATKGEKNEKKKGSVCN